MKLLSPRKRTSSLALAIALATGSAVVATAVAPVEAQAQRKKKKDDDNGGGGYSDAFRAAYLPLDEALKAEGVDAASYKPQLLELVPILVSNDEKIAGGGLIFNTGIKLSDRALQLQGMELMLESGQVPAEQVARYNFIAYQLANGLNDFGKARTYLQAAIDNNFTTETISAADLQIAMAENYFAANELNEGLAYLDNAIEARKAQGLAVDEQWYRRGLTVAYNNEVVPQVYDFTTAWLSEFSSPDNWRDAINLTRNLNEFEKAEILDLFRLSRRTKALKDASDYDYYVEAADPRRLPQEVKTVIESGYAAGHVAQSNLFLSEALQIANGRIASDRSDLPALERDARASDAGLRTVMAAASAFLSYDQYDKAAELYTKALAMPGVETQEALTRLGIAQVGLGDYAAARDTFTRVEGKREPIARLWTAYVDEQGGAAVASPAQPEVASTGG